MKKRIGFFGLVIGASMLMNSGCKNFCNEDGVGPDLLFDNLQGITVVAEAFVPGVGQVVEIVSPYLNQLMEEICDQVDCGESEREVKMRYKASANDPYEDVVFATEGSTDTTSSNAIRIATPAMNQGDEITDTDRFGFATNGIYEATELLDAGQVIAERDETNNSGAGASGKQMKTIVIEITGAADRIPGQPIVVQYLGTSRERK